MDSKHKDVNPACENIQEHIEKNVATNRLLKCKKVLKFILFLILVLTILTLATMAMASLAV